MYKKFWKRLIDLLISTIAMPFVLLLTAILGPAIWAEDHGPVFYNAPRVGKDKKQFLMYKFRSMKCNAPDIRNKDGSTYNSSNDPRVTKIGRILRKTSLDEVPQLLNVFWGDMSLIGPRPTIPSKKSLSAGLDTSKRYSVRPGITGYSQAYFRNSVSQEGKNKQDNYYVDHLSFPLDLKIFIQTIKSVIGQRNINTNS